MSTRAEIVEMARIHADQDSSTFPTVNQYNTMINFAARRVWLDLITAGFPFSFSTFTIISTGVTKYASPIAIGGNLFAINGVYYVVAGERVELKRLNEGDRAQLMSSTAVTGFAEYYTVSFDMTSGTTIELLPKSSGITYSIDYIQGFTSFASDAAQWPGPLGSDELVALRLAIMGIRKEGAARRVDAMDKETEYKDLLQTVIGTATWLDMRNPAKIRDVMSLHTRMAFDYPVAGFYGD